MSKYFAIFLFSLFVRPSAGTESPHAVRTARRIYTASRIRSGSRLHSPRSAKKSVRHVHKKTFASAKVGITAEPCSGINT
jgi:hypothetical protein